jgi:hypothetical protein
MKKILFLLVILMCALGTYAQNKVCSECGIVKYNVTYPWQHHTWCPYYRPQSSGSSSNSSTVNYGAYTVANAATSAIGALLTDALFGNKQTPKTPEEMARDAAYEEKRRILGTAYFTQIEKEREYWEFGDYKIGWDNGYIYLVNQSSGKYVIPMYDAKQRNAFYKKSKKPLLPSGSVRINQKQKPSTINAYFGIEETSNDRIRFLDSSKEPINPIFNGWLIAQDFSYYGLDNSTKKKEYNSNVYLGVAKIVEDTLQWVIKDRNGVNDHYTTLIEPLGATPYIYQKWAFPTEYAYLHGGYDITWRWKLYDVTGKVRLENIVYSADNNVIRSYGDVICVREEKKTEDGKIIASHKYYDIDLNPHPVLGSYEQVVPKALTGIGYRFIVGSEKDGYGVIDKDGLVIIPQQYVDINTATAMWNKYAKISYTSWYRKEAAQYINKPGEFEKTDHFNARMADKKLQEQYLREQMAKSEDNYLFEITKGGELTLGRYVADSECFPIASTIAPWNAIYLAVPMSEAEAFKRAFDNIKGAALGTVKWRIRNDAPCIEQVTFTMPDGKTYKL